MTPDQIAALAADRRRASAAIVHFGRDNFDGINAVLREAAEADRVAPLVLALLDVFDSMLPELRSDLGRQLLSAHLLRLAGMETP